MRTKFFPDTQFSKNQIVNYGPSLKWQKVILPSLKCHVFCFWSKFISFTQLYRKQIYKIQICHFSLYMAKYRHAKKIRKRTEIILRKMSQADGERDRWTDEQTTLIFWDPICKEEVWQFFRSFGNIIFLIYLALFWAIWNELIQEKRIKSTQLSAQRVQKQMFRVNLYNITFILFECYRSANKSIDFYFYFYYCEALQGNEECSPGNSKARHESQVTSR